MLRIANLVVYHIALDKRVSEWAARPRYEWPEFEELMTLVGQSSALGHDYPGFHMRPRGRDASQKLED